MILLNEMEKSSATKEQFKIFLKLLAPFTPHVTEELFALSNPIAKLLGNRIAKSIHEEEWPQFDPKLLLEDTFELIIQINGKMRDKFEVSAMISQKEAEYLTLARQKVKTILGDQLPRKIIFVPRRLINLVL